MSQKNCPICESGRLESQYTIDFFEKFVQKCLKPNFAFWMILFAKNIADTLENNN